jgi:DNA-binding MarR family transcriptional regulator
VVLIFIFTLVDVKCYNFDKRYELQLSVQQTSILLLFNHSEKITIADISSQTSIRGTELEKNLKTLIDLGIIQKENEGNNRLIMLNTNFTRYV